MSAAREDVVLVVVYGTFVTPFSKLACDSLPGPLTMRPLSLGPHDADMISMFSTLKPIALASTESVTLPSSILIPPILASGAIPTPQKLLLATIAMTPAHLVPCLG